MAIVLEGLYNSLTGTDTGEGSNQTAIAETALCVQPQCYVHLVDPHTDKEAREKLEKEHTNKRLFR